MLILITVLTQKYCKAHIPNIHALNSDTHWLGIQYECSQKQWVGVAIEGMDIWYMGLIGMTHLERLFFRNQTVTTLLPYCLILLQVEMSLSSYQSLPLGDSISTQLSQEQFLASQRTGIIDVRWFLVTKLWTFFSRTWYAAYLVIKLMPRLQHWIRFPSMG